MKKPRKTSERQWPERLVAALTQGAGGNDDFVFDARALDAGDWATMAADDLVIARSDGKWQLTAMGRARLARSQWTRRGSAIDPYRAQHLALAEGRIATNDGERQVTIDDAESPLAWLARRKGKDGKAHIEPAQLQAGERLRRDFTQAQMMPRMAANWDAPVADGASGSRSMTFGDAAIAARQRVHHALDAVGAEFAGLLVDVCCFLKRLEDIERERGWPARSAKVVLQLGLDRLARHYGYDAAARGRSRAAVRTWLAPGAAFGVDSV